MGKFLRETKKAIYLRSSTVRLYFLAKSLEVLHRISASFVQKKQAADMQNLVSWPVAVEILLMVQKSGDQ